MEGLGTDSDAAMQLHPNPTPYADVNAVLHDLLSSVQTLLGDHFRGMYLSGSLALGDFAPHRSDIDFVVVTDANLPDDLLSSLQAMHVHFNASSSPWATEVEAAYIPQDALRRYDPAHARHPHIERGGDEVLDMDQLDTGWVIQYYILREHGVVVAGPPPHTLIDPVPSQDLCRAAVVLMDEWWGTMLHDPAPLQYRGYQVYAVLTMCRMLYTLDSGAVVSKPIAARWAQGALGERWAALIERALAWRKDRTWGEDAQDTPGGDVDETQALIHYTLERCRQWHNPPPPAGTQGSPDDV